MVPVPFSVHIGTLREDGTLTKSWEILLIFSLIENGLLGKALHISLGLAVAGTAAGSYHLPGTRLCCGKGPRVKTYSRPRGERPGVGRCHISSSLKADTQTVS